MTLKTKMSEHGDEMGTVPDRSEEIVSNLYDESTPFLIPISQELLGPVPSEHSLSSSSVGSRSSRRSSLGQGSSNIGSSKPVIPDRQISPPMTPPRPSSPAPQVPPSGSSSIPSSPAPEISPIRSSSRPASPAPEVSPIRSSSRPASPAPEVSPIRSSSRPASPAPEVSPIRSSSRATSPSSQVSPTGSPQGAASSSNHSRSVGKWGNILPGGYDPSMGSGFKSPPKTQVLGSGNSDYGYGSIINTRKWAIEETVKSAEHALNEGQRLMISMMPDNVNCRIGRADTLVQLGRLDEALREYGVAHQLDLENGKLHQRLSLLHLRLGVIEMAELHMTRASPECKVDISALIEKMKDHLIRAEIARKNDEWMPALRELNTLILAGADGSQSILAFKAEMLLRLNRLDKAEETISKALKLKPGLPTSVEFLGMDPEAYVCAVHAQIEMALGRFANAVTEADRAHRIDQFSDEISAIQTNVLLTNGAHIKGNKHYGSGEYLKACDEYSIGLKYAKSNVSLLSNLAACHWKLERWGQCIDVCNEVLRIRPNDCRALLQRADSYAKLQKWSKNVRNGSKVAPRESQNVEVSGTITGVKEITTVVQFQEAIAIPGNSIAFFYYSGNHRCISLSPYVDAFCTSYPWVNLIKVDICEHPSIAKAAKMYLVPSFVVYREGHKMKEIVGPTQVEFTAWVEQLIASQIEGKEGWEDFNWEQED